MRGCTGSMKCIGMCFKILAVHPFLDDDEFKNGRWSKLSDSFLYSVYESASADQPNDKSSNNEANTNKRFIKKQILYSLF